MVEWPPLASVAAAADRQTGGVGQSIPVRSPASSSSRASDVSTPVPCRRENNPRLGLAGGLGGCTSRTLSRLPEEVVLREAKDEKNIYQKIYI